MAHCRVEGVGAGGRWVLGAGRCAAGKPEGDLQGGRWALLAVVGAGRCWRRVPGAGSSGAWGSRQAARAAAPPTPAAAQPASRPTAQLPACPTHQLSTRQDEIADALERIIAGPEKKGAVMSEKKKRLVAYHEAGHALVRPGQLGGGRAAAARPGRQAWPACGAPAGRPAQPARQPLSINAQTATLAHCLARWAPSCPSTTR